MLVHRRDLRLERCRVVAHLLARHVLHWLEGGQCLATWVRVRVGVRAGVRARVRVRVRG